MVVKDFNCNKCLFYCRNIKDNQRYCKHYTELTEIELMLSKLEGNSNNLRRKLIDEYWIKHKPTYK
jgi:hypothetical protein